MKKQRLIAAILAAVTILNVYGAASSSSQPDFFPLFGGKPVSSSKGTLIRQELKHNLLGKAPNSYFTSQEALAQLIFDHMKIDSLNDVLPDIATECYLYARAKLVPQWEEEQLRLGLEKSSIFEDERSDAACSLMPPWLKPHFLGASIKDLIDNNILNIPKSFPLTPFLFLNGRNINDLTGIHNIPDIGKAIFISLTNNLISTIPPETFAGLDNLCALRLSGNQITSITQIGVTAIKGLESLDLRGNPIEVIESKAFATLKAFKFLFLNGTHISEGEQDRIQAEVSVEVGRRVLGEKQKYVYAQLDLIS